MAVSVAETMRKRGTAITKIIFIEGVSGVGKSTATQKLCNKLHVMGFSVGRYPGCMGEQAGCQPEQFPKGTTRDAKHPTSHVLVLRYLLSLFSAGIQKRANGTARVDNQSAF